MRCLSEIEKKHEEIALNWKCVIMSRMRLSFMFAN